MPADIQSISKRLVKQLPVLQDRIASADSSLSERMILVREIVSKLFDFKELNAEEGGTSSPLLNVELNGEVKYAVYVTAIGHEIETPPASVVKEALAAQAQFLALTNGPMWNVSKTSLESPSVYSPARSFDLSSPIDGAHEPLAESMTEVCKEFYNKDCIVDSANRNRWYGYGRQTSKSVDFLYLVQFWLYEDGSEKVHVPELGLTWWGDKPFDARNFARKAIECHLAEVHGKEYSSADQFETIASRKEGSSMLRNVAWGSD